MEFRCIYKTVLHYKGKGRSCANFCYVKYSHGTYTEWQYFNVLPLEITSTDLIIKSLYFTKQWLFTGETVLHAKGKGGQLILIYFNSHGIIARMTIFFLISEI